MSASVSNEDAANSLMKDYRVEFDSDDHEVSGQGRCNCRFCRRCECSRMCCKKWFLRNLLLMLLVVAMLAGIALGIALRYVEPRLSARDIMYLKFPGDVLLRMLKMLILPLVVSSLISGLAALDARASGTMGAKATLYYVTTTVCAVIIGIVLVVTIKPGEGARRDINRVGRSKVVHPADSLLDLIRNMIPDNLIVACFRQTKTEQVPIPSKPLPTVMNDTASLYNLTLGLNDTENEIEYKPVTSMSEGSNILGIVVFSIAFGTIISRMGEKCRPLVAFFDAMNEAVMALIGVVIWYSPIGVLFLVSSKIVAMDNIETAFQQIGLYTATVLAGLAIHGLIVLPLIYVAFVRKNPFTFVGGILQALLTAAATASSAATLPVTFRCLEENLNIDRRVTRFLLPIGATINMDGTALYEAVASIFIAQVNGISLSIGQIIIVCITATAASIGAAAVPQAGLVAMLIVLTSVGLPTEDITLILAVDWFLDRCRTTVNVIGDSIGTAIVEKYSKATLRKLDVHDAEFLDTTDSRNMTKDGYSSGGPAYNRIHASSNSNV